jgi:hypothetical protein
MADQLPLRTSKGAPDVSRRDAGVTIASRLSEPVNAGVAALVLATLSLAGCSVALARRPPPYYRVTPSFECTKSLAPAVIDTTLASIYAVSTAGNEAIRLSGRGAWFVGSPGLSILTGLAAAVFGASAAWGFNVAHECREALNQSVELSSAAPP